MKEVDQIESVRRTDENGDKVLIREDNTVVIYYKDGRVYVKHHDGTMILTDKDNITVENSHYCTVLINDH